MPFRVETIPRLKICVLSFTGLIDRADLDGHFPVMLAAPGFGPEMDELVVLRPGACLSEVDFKAALVQSERLIKTSAAPPGAREKRRAIVASDVVQRTMMKMFEALVRANAPPGFQLQCFDDIETALSWIEAGQTPPLPLDRREIARCIEAKVAA